MGHCQYLVRKEEMLYDMNELELPTKEWNKYITAFWREI